MLDFNKLTLGEVAMIEDLARQSISEIGDETTPKGRALSALAMVAKRRAGFPDFTFNAAQALTLEEANEIIGLGAVEEDPEEGKE